MHIELKLSVWKRYDVDHRERAKILEAAERGDLVGPSDIEELLDDPNGSLLMETADFAKPDENKGIPTIQIYNENRKAMWDNRTHIKGRSEDIHNFMMLVSANVELNKEEYRLLHNLADDLYGKALSKK